MNCGIYKITNIVSCKVYIGSSRNIKDRFYRHKTKLRHKKHHSILLQRAWDKYGESAFIFETLEACLISELILREQTYLDIYESFKAEYGYNICSNAIGPMAGFKHSEATKEKVRLACIGRKHTEEAKGKIAEWHRNKVVKEETKHKLRIANLGKPFSAESRRKVSDGNIGKKRTDETKEMMRAIRTGRRFSDKTKQKMSLARKAWWVRNREASPDYSHYQLAGV